MEHKMDLAIEATTIAIPVEDYEAKIKTLVEALLAIDELLQNKRESQVKQEAA